MDLVLPPLCPACLNRAADAAAHGVCETCHDGILHAAEACGRCGRPLPQAAIAGEGGCAACRDRRFAFDRTVALGVYEGDLRDIVLRIKQPGNEALTLALGRMLAERCRGTTPRIAAGCLVPVPTHWTRRLAWRGAAAELLAEGMGRELRTPVRRLLCCRRRTRKQGTLRPTERQQNVRRAFRYAAKYDIRGAHVVAVDDVMTTGATANEVSRVLREAGAATITLAVVARGIGFG